MALARDHALQLPTLRGYIEQRGQRTEAIKSMRQRSGLKRERGNPPYDLFGVTDWDGLVRRMEEAYYLMPHGREKDAIGNALAIGGPLSSVEAPDNVIVRRHSLVHYWRDVSLRTVERLEETGAEMLADAVELSMNDRQLFERLTRGYLNAVAAIYAAAQRRDIRMDDAFEHQKEFLPEFIGPIRDYLDRVNPRTASEPQTQHPS